MENKLFYRTKETFEFLLDNEMIKVEYDGILYGIVLHFSFYGKNISETGYRSHFLFTDIFESLNYNCIKKCANDIAKDLKAELFKTHPDFRKLDINQLSLF